MRELINWLQKPENMVILGAIVIAISAGIRGLGEVCLAIGKLNKNPDKWDTIGAVLCNISTKIGKFLAWLGIGNKQKEVK